MTGNKAQSWAAPCIGSLQLFLLRVFNSIQKRSLRALERKALKGEEFPGVYRNFSTTCHK